MNGQMKRRVVWFCLNLDLDLELFHLSDCFRLLVPICEFLAISRSFNFNIRLFGARYTLPLHSPLYFNPRNNSHLLVRFRRSLFHEQFISPHLFEDEDDDDCDSKCEQFTFNCLSVGFRKRNGKGGSINVKFASSYMVIRSIEREIFMC